MQAIRRDEQHYPFQIERLECGAWLYVDSSKQEIDAYRLASRYCRKYGEDRIQIVTPDLQIIK